MLRWTVMQIHDALGEAGSWALPRLLRPVELSVRVPDYQVRLLETLAQDAGKSVEEYVYTVFLGLETTVSADETEKILPGFRDAIRFPER